MESKRPAEEEADAAGEAEQGPPRPPEDLDDEPEAGPTLPKAKKRKVRRRGSAAPCAACYRPQRSSARTAAYRCSLRPCLRPAPRRRAPPPPRRAPPQVLQFEQQYLEALPSAQMYEKSYMHRDTITHCVVRQRSWVENRSCTLCCVQTRSCSKQGSSLAAGA